MKSLRLSILLSAILVAAVSGAEVSFSTFGAGNSFDAAGGYTVASGTSAIGDQSVAQQFTSATSGKLASIAFAAFYVSGTGSVKVGLYADASDGIGAEMASWITSVNTSLAQIYALPIPGTVNLAAGHKYWIGLLAQDDSWLVWNASQPQVNGLVATSYDTTPSIGSANLSAFRVQTQAAPEPSTLAFFGLSGLALVVRRRARR